MRAAEEIIKELPLNVNDIARLVVELTEELGERAYDLGKVEMMRLLRRVLRLGVEELKRQEWCAENPVARVEVPRVQERGCMVVPGRCSKTGGGRVVPLRKRAALRGGRLRIPRNWEERWRRLRRAAGFAAGQWVPDVYRHTFASYHAARFRDLGALQLEMGHRSADLLRSRYLNLPQVNDAGLYWANHPAKISG